MFESPYCRLSERYDVFGASEHIKDYSESVKNLASGVVTLFGSNDFSDVVVDIDYDFNPDAFEKLLNKEEIEGTKFRAIPVPIQYPQKGCIKYNVTNKEYYAGESVDVCINKGVALLCHRINRLD